MLPRPGTGSPIRPWSASLIYVKHACDGRCCLAGDVPKRNQWTHREVSGVCLIVMSGDFVCWCSCILAEPCPVLLTGKVRIGDAFPNTGLRAVCVQISSSTNMSVVASLASIALDHELR